MSEHWWRRLACVPDTVTKSCGDGGGTSIRCQDAASTHAASTRIHSREAQPPQRRFCLATGGLPPLLSMPSRDVPSSQAHALSTLHPEVPTACIAWRSGFRLIFGQASRSEICFDATGSVPRLKGGCRGSPKHLQEVCIE